MRVTAATTALMGLCHGSGWLAAALLALPVQAQTMAERIALDGGPARLTLSESQGEPLATATRGSGASVTARQTVLWMRARDSALAWGVGVEQRGPAAGREILPRMLPRSGVLVGLSLDTGPHSQLTLQTPLLHASSLTPEQPMPRPEQVQQLRMGLAFHTHNPYADLRRGVRVELSGQTTLSFRPRGGRIGVTLQSRW